MQQQTLESKMNITKVGKLVLSAALGSLLWAGCASTPAQPPEQPGLETTVDPLTTGPNTQPQYSPNYGFAPYQAGWTVESIE
jgi:hypothetical protein